MTREEELFRLTGGRPEAFVVEEFEETSEDKIIPQQMPELKEGFKRIIKDVKVSKSKPPFILVGRNGKNKQGEGMDLVQEMAKMSKAELWLFSKVEENLDWRNNTGTCIAYDLSKQDKNKLATGYKKLKEKNILKRTKREHYMINPRLIIPEDFESNEIIFESL